MRSRSVIATPDFAPPSAPRAPGRSPSASYRRTAAFVRDEACPPQVPRSRPGTPRTSRAPTPERTAQADDAATDEMLQHRSVSCASTTSGWDDAPGMSMARVRHARRRGTLAAPPLATPVLDDDDDSWGAPAHAENRRARDERDTHGDVPSRAGAAPCGELRARPAAPPLVTPAPPESLERLLFVNGRWVAASVAEWRALYRPATETPAANAAAPYPGSTPRSGANSTASAPPTSAAVSTTEGLRSTPIAAATHRSVSAQTDAGSPVLCAFAVERENAGIRSGSITTIAVSEPRRRQH